MPKQFVHIIVDLIEFFEKHKKQIVAITIHSVIFILVALAILAFLVTIF